MDNTPIAQIAASTIKGTEKRNVYPKTIDKAVLTTDKEGNEVTLDNVLIKGININGETATPDENGVIDISAVILMSEQETPVTSTAVNGYLLADHYFYAGGTFYCLAIPCSAGEKYRIYNTDVNSNATASLLWMVFNTTENLSSNSSAVEAQSTDITVGTQGVYDVTIPDNGVMLYVAYYPNLVPTVTLVKDYVHTDNNFSDEYKEKIDNYPSVVFCTQEAYDMMVSGGTVDADTIYYTTES